MTWITRPMAEEVAAILKRHHSISGIELFGSIARDGQGNDLDLIIISDDGGREFIELMGEGVTGLSNDMRFDIYHNFHLRVIVAIKVFGDDFFDLLLEAEERIYWARIDLFVFPQNWREHLNVLQDALPHKDPEFMRNIARDAIAI